MKRSLMKSSCLHRPGPCLFVSMRGYIVSVYFCLSSHTNNFVWWQLQISKTLEKHAMSHKTMLNRGICA
ncbi:hypothetical protein BA011_37535 (plasmid) [Rhizobium leguminosarum]|uniref:Uncharacterized protein n=1 Tax=Rhizobium leguminosarum TaxID=384 RepID=A0A1B1CNH6_RHILE|nr:hypothetical protein BA011_37535 [Rhizobium leguminosarum]